MQGFVYVYVVVQPRACSSLAAVADALADSADSASVALQAVTALWGH